MTLRAVNYNFIVYMEHDREPGSVQVFNRYGKAVAGDGLYTIVDQHGSMFAQYCEAVPWTSIF